MAVELGNDWDKLLGPEFEKDYYLNLRRFLIHEYRSATVYPDMYSIFEALKRTSFAATRVVLLGQDPYHGRTGPRPGLSVPRECPASLQTFSRSSALGLPYLATAAWSLGGPGCCFCTTLTVREGQAGSHRDGAGKSLPIGC